MADPTRVDSAALRWTPTGSVAAKTGYDAVVAALRDAGINPETNFALIVAIIAYNKIDASEPFTGGSVELPQLATDAKAWRDFARSDHYDQLVEGIDRNALRFAHVIRFNSDRQAAFSNGLKAPDPTAASGQTPAGAGRSPMRNERPGSDPGPIGAVASNRPLDDGRPAATASQPPVNSPSGTSPGRPALSAGGDASATAPAGNVQPARVNQQSGRPAAVAPSQPARSEESAEPDTTDEAAPAPIAPQAQAPGGAPSRPLPGQGYRPGDLGTIDNTLAAGVDPSRLVAQFIQATAASDRAQGIEWAKALSDELLSESPNEKQVGQLVQQLMSVGSGPDAPNFPALELYNEVMNERLGSPEFSGQPNDIMSYALVRQLHDAFDTDEAALQIAMVYIRNASARFEAEDYVYFGGVRGFQDGFFADWGIAEYTLDEVYSALRDPDQHPDISREQNIDQVNLRFFMKYGSGKDPKYNAGLALDLNDANVTRRFAQLLANTSAPTGIPASSPLAQVAMNEFDEAKARQLLIAPYVDRSADGKPKPAYQAALAIAQRDETAVLDVAETIRPDGADHPLAWNKVEAALASLADTGFFISREGRVSKEAYPQETTGTISLDAFIDAHLSDDRQTLYRTYLKPTAEQHGRFELQPEQMAAYAALRIQQEHDHLFNDDVIGALARMGDYVRGAHDPTTAGRISYAALVEAAKAQGVHDDMLDILEDAKGVSRVAIELLEKGDSPNSPEMKLQRLMATNDRHELRAMLEGLSLEEMRAMWAATEDRGFADFPAVFAHIARVERGAALNAEAPAGEQIPPPAMARFLLSVTDYPEGSPEQDTIARYHPAVFLRDALGRPLAASPAIKLVTAFHYGDDTRAQTLVDLANGIPYGMREQVLADFQTLDTLLGNERTLVDAYADRLSDAALDRVKPKLQPLSFDPQRSFDENLADLKDALGVEAKWLASAFTQEYGVVDIRLREMETVLERVTRAARARGEVDPQASELTAAETTEIASAVERALRASLHSREEIEAFENKTREYTVMAVALAASLATMGMGGVAIGTLRIGTLTINNVPTATAIRFLGTTAKRTAIVGASAAVAGTAADYAVNGQLDMSMRDYGHVAGTSLAAVLATSGTGFVGLTAGGAAGFATFNGSEAIHDERYKDISGDMLEGAAWGGGGAAAIWGLMRGASLVLAKYKALGGQSSATPAAGTGSSTNTGTAANAAETGSASTGGTANVAGAGAASETAAVTAAHVQADRQLVARVRSRPTGTAVSRAEQAERWNKFYHQRFAPTLQELQGVSIQSLTAARELLETLRALGVSAPPPYAYQALRNMLNRLFGEGSFPAGAPLKDDLLSVVASIDGALAGELAAATTMEVTEFVIARLLREQLTLRAATAAAPASVEAGALAGANASEAASAGIAGTGTANAANSGNSAGAAATPSQQLASAAKKDPIRFVKALREAMRGAKTAERPHIDRVSRNLAQRTAAEARVYTRPIKDEALQDIRSVQHLANKRAQFSAQVREFSELGVERGLINDIEQAVQAIDGILERAAVRLSQRLGEYARGTGAAAELNVATRTQDLANMVAQFAPLRTALARTPQALEQLEVEFIAALRRVESSLNNLIAAASPQTASAAQVNLAVVRHSLADIATLDGSQLASQATRLVAIIDEQAPGLLAATDEILLAPVQAMNDEAFEALLISAKTHSGIRGAFEPAIARRLQQSIPETTSPRLRRTVRTLGVGFLGLTAVDVGAWWFAENQRSETGTSWAEDLTYDTPFEPLTDVFPGHLNLAQLLFGWFADPGGEAREKQAGY